jgi:hypothetical protein
LKPQARGKSCANLQPEQAAGNYSLQQREHIHPAQPQQLFSLNYLQKFSETIWKYLKKI